MQQQPHHNLQHMAEQMAAQMPQPNVTAGGPAGGGPATAVAAAAAVGAGGVAPNGGGVVVAGGGPGGGGGGQEPIVYCPEFPIFHQPVQGCRCPTCALTAYMAGIYESQFQDIYEGASGVAPRLTRCPMFDTYGFCLYSCTCLLTHDHSRATPLTKYYGHLPLAEPQLSLPDHTGEKASTEKTDADRYCSDGQLNAPLGQRRKLSALIEEANRLSDEHDRDIFRCLVCGFDQFTYPYPTAKVGELGFSVFCPRCTTPVYFPILIYVIEGILVESKDDYQAFKDKCEEVRRSLAEELKIPFSYEAHRLASTYFAWSLTSPADATQALTAMLGEDPKLTTVISVGSGTGYVEHVFNQASSALAQNGTASRLQFLAYDEIVRPARFSVQVQFGSPSIIASRDCSDTALLLCWPPFASVELQQSTMAYDTLRVFVEQGGQYVIYIGDVSSTGDFQFHGLLASHFAPLRAYRVRKEIRRWYPQEMGLVYAGNDTIGVYRYRGGPLPPPGSMLPPPPPPATAQQQQQQQQQQQPMMLPPQQNQP